MGGDGGLMDNTLRAIISELVAVSLELERLRKENAELRELLEARVAEVKNGQVEHGAPDLVH